MQGFIKSIEENPHGGMIITMDGDDQYKIMPDVLGYIKPGTCVDINVYSDERGNWINSISVVDTFIQDTTHLNNGVYSTRIVYVNANSVDKPTVWVALCFDADGEGCYISGVAKTMRGAIDLLSKESLYAMYDVNEVLLTD